MLFAITHTKTGGLSEGHQENTRRSFRDWKQPTGYKEKVHYAFADGSGGIAQRFFPFDS